MDAYRLSTDEFRALKLRIEGLFAKGLTRVEVCSKAGITRENLAYWRRVDQMFDHHLIKLDA